MPTIYIKSSKHSELIDITRDVEAQLPSDFKDGVCHAFSTHTTAGLTINENADPNVASDIIAKLENLVPWDEKEYKHFEGNSAAHVKSSMMGFSQTIPVENGKLVLGTWQALYFCEFDGPRNRKVDLRFLRSA